MNAKGIRSWTYLFCTLSLVFRTDPSEKAFDFQHTENKKEPQKKQNLCL